MELTYDGVVQAITNLNAKPPENYEESQAILQTYAEEYSPNALFISYQLLSDPHLTVIYKMYGASYIKNNMNLLWNQFPVEAKASIREYCYNFVQNYEGSLNDGYFLVVVEILASYVLFQFPEDFPEVGPLFFTNELQSSPQQQFIIWKLYATVIKLLENSKKIAIERVQHLRNLFIDNSETLLFHVYEAISQPQSVIDGLSIFNGFLQWSDYNSISNTIPILQRICFEFVYQNAYKDASIECLTTLFNVRTDGSAYASFVPLIITSFGSADAKFENSQHITSDQNVLGFLEKLLLRFLQPVLMIFDPTLSDENPPTERTMAIIQTCQKFGIEQSQIHQCLQSILGVILSQRSPENLDESFWTFWVNIFMQMNIEAKLRTQRFQPLTVFLKPSLPQIRQAIYQCVPLDLQDDNYNEDKLKSEKETGIYTPSDVYTFCSNRSRVAWSHLCQLDVPGAIEFIKQQDPSTALCYAIGNLDLCSNKDFDICLLQTEIGQLYENVETLSAQDPTFPVALLFCFSHTISLSNGGEFFLNFIEFAIKCVNEQPPPISSAATAALYYASRKNEERFLAEESIAENTLFENAENYLTKLGRDDSVRMFKTISLLISKITTKERMARCYQLISEPLLGALNSQYEPEKVFDCIKEASNSAGPNSTIFMSYLWEMLYQVANAILSSDVSLNLVEAILDTMSACLANEIYNIDRVRLILSLMSNRLQAQAFIESCFYNFISVIRSQHQEMNEMLPEIIDTFVLPGLASQHPNCSGIMSMLSQFTFQIFDFPWFVDLAIQSIDSCKTEDNKYSLECLRHVFGQIRTQEAFLATVSSNLLQPILVQIFKSLTDTLHKESIYDLNRFLREVMNRAYSLNLMQTQEFTSMLVASIQAAYPEPQENFYLQFVQTLMGSVDKPFQFSKNISGFLILIRVMSPGDGDAFSTQKVEDTGEDQLVFGRGRIIQLKSDTGDKIELIPPRRRFRLAVKKSDQQGE